MKNGLGKSVLQAAEERIARAFDDFEQVCVSFSGGKDSSVLLHLTAAEARRRGRKIHVLFIDLEAQYRLTIEHVRQMYEEYTDVIDRKDWVSLPMVLRNAVSNYEPRWQCWEPERRQDWVREPDALSITDPSVFPFFKRGMEFEEFVVEYARWLSQKGRLVTLVGIRTDESLNRFRTIASKTKKTHANLQWTTQITDLSFNAYPIYDWRTEDIWRYVAKTGASYNRLYDRMHLAGLTIHQMRICQPYGDDQRRGLWLYHVIEPETWARVVARVNGANSGSLYSRESGNIQGIRKITLPEGHTWESFAKLLLSTLPPAARNHYENKIAVFLKWYVDRGYPDGIPDEGPLKKGHPSWARICKALLRNDWWCKGLSFSQTKSESYERYKATMQRRRELWGLI